MVSESLPAESSGGRICAAVRFIAAGAPMRVTICHCIWCQRPTGSASVTEVGRRRTGVISRTKRDFGSIFVSAVAAEPILVPCWRRHHGFEPCPPELSTIWIFATFSSIRDATAQTSPTLPWSMKSISENRQLAPGGASRSHLMRCRAFCGNTLAPVRSGRR